MRGAVLILGLTAGPALAADDPVDPVGALEALFAVETTGEGMRIEQALDLDGCEAVLTTTVWGEPENRRRMVETARFEVGLYPAVAESAPGSLDLTARRYFSRAGDDGLVRWLDELAATRDDPDRGARMRELQLRVDRGEFGEYARRNGYEMRSFLEGDPEPYYAMPLPAVSLTLPEEDAEAAEGAWLAYAETCTGDTL